MNRLCSLMQRWIALSLLGLFLAVINASAFAQAVISNGTVSIGVNRVGSLIYQGVGLRFVPTNGEALAPGCPCEGWGVADVITQRFGKAGQNFGDQNVVAESFQSTSSTATSITRIVSGTTPWLRMTHAFKPAPESPNVYEVTVTVENISPAAVDLRYRRAMDWDVPPTTFSEMVTIVTNGARDVAFSSDNGFADGNPLTNASQILFTGERENSGPADHGAVFDFNLGKLDPGSQRTFVIYYGAAANVPAARSVLGTVAAEMYSLGYPNTPSLTPQGSPNTYIFGFKGVGGTPAIARDADLTMGALRLIDNGTGKPASLTARVGNAGGKTAANFNVVFYDGDPAQAGTVLLGTRTIASLNKEEFVDVQLDDIATLSGRALFAVVDPERRVTECSLANNAVTIPLAPAVALGNISVAPDQPNYGPNAAVNFYLAITNPGRFAYAYQVDLVITDAQGNVVASFPRRDAGSVAAGATIALTQAWNTGATFTGGYRVTARLYAADRVIANNSADFTIGAGVAGADVSPAIRTDRSRYASTDTVIATNRVRNVTANNVRDELRGITTIQSPSGALFFTASETLPQLAPGAVREYSYRVPLNAAVAGIYRATLSVRDAQNQEVATSTATFEVVSTAANGVGLSGRIGASPKPVELGTTASLTFEVKNAGNSALTDLPLKIRLVDVAQDVVVAEFNARATVGIGATYASATGWTATGGGERLLTAVLYAVIDGRETVLAQDTLKVIVPPIRYEPRWLHGQLAPKVLALVSCPDAAGIERDACAAEREHALREALNEQGLNATVVTDAASFVTELRCNAPNMLWIAGGAQKLDAPARAEVRESVRRGSTLVLEGAWTDANTVLGQLAGVRYLGVGSTQTGIESAGELLGSATSAIAGSTTRFESTARVEARFTGTQDGALFVSRFGVGKTAVAAFDLSASLVSNAAGARAFVQTLLAALAPDSQPQVFLGERAELISRVNNLGGASTVQSTLVVPTGLKLVQARPEATLDGNRQLVYRTPIAATSKADVLLSFAGESVGAFTLKGQYLAVRADGGSVLPQSASIALAVDNPDTLLAGLNARIQALIASGGDAVARSAAASLASQAQNAYADRQYTTAFNALMEAASRLHAVAVTDAAWNGVRLDIARLLGVIGRQTCTSPSCGASQAKKIDLFKFTPNAELERLEFLAGAVGDTTPEIVLGTHPVQAATVANLDWVNGELLEWRLNVLTDGRARLQLTKNGVVRATANYDAIGGPFRLGNAVQLWAKVDRALGQTSIELMLDRINGQTAGEQLVGNGNVDNPVRSTWSIPIYAFGVTLEGRIRLSWPTQRPTASRLQATVTLGNAQCQ